MSKIPKINKHSLELMSEGIGSNDSREYCECEKCVILRKRRDNIKNSLKHRISRWFNNNC
jgi:hypothetical protein